MAKTDLCRYQCHHMAPQIEWSLEWYRIGPCNIVSNPMWFNSVSERADHSKGKGAIVENTAVES